MIFGSTWDYSIFKSEIDNPNSRYIVAKYEDKILGFCGVAKLYDEGHIMTINVHKDFRRLTIGSILLEKIIQISKELNLKILTLEVRNSNFSAQNLYKKYGFVTVGTRKNYYKIHNSNLKEDAIIMTLELLQVNNLL